MSKRKSFIIIFELLITIGLISMAYKPERFPYYVIGVASMVIIKVFALTRIYVLKRNKGLSNYKLFLYSSIEASALFLTILLLQFGTGSILASLLVYYASLVLVSHLLAKLMVVIHQKLVMPKGAI